MAHSDTVILSAEGVDARTLYCIGPIVPELTEVEAPRIVDTAPELDRRTGVSMKEFGDVGDGVGIMHADQGAGLWDSGGVWSVNGRRVTPSPGLKGSQDFVADGWAINMHTRIGSHIVLEAFHNNAPADFQDYIYYQIGIHLYKIDHNFSTQILVDTAPVNSANGMRIIEFSESGTLGANHRLYSFWQRSTIGLPGPQYRRSDHGNFGVWSDGGRVLNDAIVFHALDAEILLGADPFFGRIVMSTDGDAWNIDDPNDGQFILDQGFGEITFVGVADAPWGVPAVYFINNQKLYVLNYDTREAFEIPLQNTLGVYEATIFQGQIAVTDQWNVWLYDPSSQRSRRIGLPVEEGGGGLPFSLQQRVIQLFPVGDYLCALMGSYKVKGYRLVFWNGRGWHPIWPPGDEVTAGKERFPIGGAAFSIFDRTEPAQSRSSGVMVISTDDLANTADKIGTWRAYSLPSVGTELVNLIDIPWQWGTSPQSGLEEQYFDTPWFRVYGDLLGAVMQLATQCSIPQLASGDGTLPALRVYYRTARDNFNTRPGNFKLLGSVTGSASAIVGPWTIFPFGDQDGDNLYGGAAFRDIQLRFEFIPASDAGNNKHFPEYFGSILTWSKHTTRKRFTFIVDVNQTIIEEGGTAFQNFSDVWKHIQNCINNPLSKLEVPNFYKSRGLIKGMSALKDDWSEDAVDVSPDVAIVGLGRIQIVFEEIAPYDSDLFQAQIVPA